MKTLLYILGMFPVFFVLSIVIYTYYVFVFVLSVPLISQQPWRLVSLFLYHVVLFFFLWSFLGTVFTDPGGIPNDFEERGYNPIQSKDGSNRRRECSKCGKPKPDRSHHCSICKRCILKMDHHCPWVNNCVGWRNYKAFVLFLTYTVLLSAVVSLSSLDWLFSNVFQRQMDMREVQIVITFFIAAVFGLGLVFFAGAHYRLVLKNRTTIEDLDSRGAADHPWDLGKRANWRQVFGERVWEWPFPVPPRGDGLHFPHRSQTNSDRHPLV